MKKFRGDERGESGFTLPEVMIVIALLGIIAAIATPTWWGVVESRNVESATNQVVADLRLAHTQATNRLAPRLVFAPTSSGSSYQTGPQGGLSPRSLPEGVTITRTSSPPSAPLVFKPDGRIEPSGSGSHTIRVAATDGNPSRNIQINAQTSRVKVD